MKQLFLGWLENLYGFNIVNIIEKKKKLTLMH